MRGDCLRCRCHSPPRARPRPFPVAAAGHGLSLAGFAREILRGRASPVAVAGDLLSLLGPADLADQPASRLLQGQRKLVGVARALAAGGPVVCLDEPAAGPDSSQSADLGRRLRAIAGYETRDNRAGPGDRPQAQWRHAPAAAAAAGDAPWLC